MTKNPRHPLFRNVIHAPYQRFQMAAICLTICKQMITNFGENDVNLIYYLAGKFVHITHIRRLCKEAMVGNTDDVINEEVGKMDIVCSNFGDWPTHSCLPQC